MAKIDKAAYKAANERFMADIATKEGVKPLGSGIFYREIARGNGPKPTASSVVSVYYRGSLADGRVFDDNMRNRVPDAMRLRDLIVGWQIALKNMPVGSHWQVFIPAAYGYGSRSIPGIPANSALVFDIKLVGVC